MRKKRLSLPYQKAKKRFVRPLLTFFAALSLSLGLGYCTPAGVEKQPLGLDQKGVLSLLLTDFPIANHDVTSVMVHFKSIEVHSDTDGWLKVVDFGPEGKEFDLLKLQNGVTSPLGYFALKPGKYTQMRLILTDNNYLEVNTDGTPLPQVLETPSATQTGIKLVHPFEITQGGYTVLTLDFNAEKSITYNDGRGFALKPVIKVIAAETSPAAAVTIGPEGASTGIIGEIMLDVPAGSVDDETNLEIVPSEATAMLPPFSSRQFLSRRYVITPESAVFNNDITVTIYYDSQEVKTKKMLEESLSIVYFDETQGAWVSVDSTVDTATRTVSAQVSALGEFGLMGDSEGPSIHPAQVQAAGLSQTPEKVSATLSPSKNATLTSVNLHLFKDGQMSAAVVTPMSFNAGTGKYEALLDAALFYPEISTEAAPLFDIQVYIEAVDSTGKVSHAPAQAQDASLLTWHTYQYDPDADKDSMNDRWEHDHGLDPTRDDSASDFDGDGLSNLAEYTGATNPAVFDALIGGTISGLGEGEVIELLNNGETLVVTGTAATSDSFEFGGRIATGGSYAVSVQKAPEAKNCSLTGAEGAIASSHALAIAIVCESAQDGFVFISGGSNHSLAIKSDGTLWGWGTNYYKQLGDPSVQRSAIPIQIGTATWKTVTGGGTLSAGIQSDGTLWVWGQKPGHYSYIYQPQQVGSDRNWKEVKAGGSFVLALKNDGTLWSWGYNRYGSIGDGSTVNRLEPVQVGGGTSDWAAIGTGWYHAFGIKTDGTLWGWGMNSSGQVGDSTKTARTTPVQIGTDTWKQVDGGNYYTHGIKTDGTLWAWGYGRYGIGAGYGVNSTVPIQIGSATWKSVSVSSETSLGIQNDGSLWSWGHNNYGQIGDNSWYNRYSPVRVGTATWKQVASSSYASSGISPDGALWGWGSGGLTGDGTQQKQLAPVMSPVSIPPLKPGEYPGELVAGGYHTMVIKRDGALWGFGYNSYGQLGINSSYYRTANPTKLWYKWSKVSPGYFHTLAIQDNGTLWAWGSASYGKLGNYRTSGKYKSPVKISSATDWKEVIGGGNHSLAIKTNGTLYAWGKNYYGEAGVGKYPYRLKYPYPVTKGGGTLKWNKVAAGFYHTVGIQSDGSLWTWGSNSLGQLGTGYTWKKEYYPRKISSQQWNSVCAGHGHTMAVKAGGTLWGFGYNRYGQLGDGSSVNRTKPVQVGTGSDWIMVACGSTYTLGIKSDGTLWAWGYNYYGQLGIGSKITQYRPVQVGNETWISVSANQTSYHTVGILSTGQYRTWGYNYYGQLGDFTYSNKYKPTTIY